MSTIYVFMLTGNHSSISNFACFLCPFLVNSVSTTISCSLFHSNLRHGRVNMSDAEFDHIWIIQSSVDKCTYVKHVSLIPLKKATNI